MTTAYIHTAALLKKQFPFGIPRTKLDEVAREKPLPVVFFSAIPLSPAANDLLTNAAVKGLKLQSSQFAIESGTRTRHAVHLVACGDISDELYKAKNVGSLYKAPSVDAILADPEQKKLFWELIKPIGASVL
jgi:hypothetical protein